MKQVQEKPAVSILSFLPWSLNTQHLSYWVFLYVPSNCTFAFFLISRSSSMWESGRISVAGMNQMSNRGSSPQTNILSVAIIKGTSLLRPNWCEIFGADADTEILVTKIRNGNLILWQTLFQTSVHWTVNTSLISYSITDCPLLAKIHNTILNHQSKHFFSVF